MSYRRFFSLPSLLVALAIMLMVSRVAVIAQTSNAASLTRGQTTQDGTITLMIEKLTTGSLSVSMKNNNLMDVMVDSYTLSAGSPFECSGKKLRIPGNEIQFICRVSPINQFGIVASPSASTPDPFAGRASLQMALRWHVLQRARVNRVPAPSPSPNLAPTP